MKNSIKNNLEQLLEESPESAKKREQYTFDEIAGGDYDSFILFGSGILGKRTLEGLRKVGIEPYGFTDNNSKLWNTSIEGLPVFSPEEAVKKYKNSVYILTIWSDMIGHPFNEINLQLSKIGNVKLISFQFLYWKFPEVFLPYFEMDLPNKVLEQKKSIIEAFDILEDDFSRKEFYAQVQLRLWGNYNFLSPPVKFQQYFPGDIFQLGTDESFIDCGAFDGDTFKAFYSKINGFFNVYAGFEPDPENFIKLKDNVQKINSNVKKIFIYPYAVSDCNKKINFEADGTLQSLIKTDGNSIVECVSLDNRISFAPTYIKMDVEGAEPDVIIGATKLIKEYSPILAVSVYHQYDHLWKLPSLIKTLNTDYKLYLRPHCEVGWDLVCYAVPSNRQIKNN